MTQDTEFSRCLNSGKKLLRNDKERTLILLKSMLSLGMILF
jgi:hypothetical protein